MGNPFRPNCFNTGGGAGAWGSLTVSHSYHLDPHGETRAAFSIGAEVASVGPVEPLGGVETSALSSVQKRGDGNGTMGSTAVRQKPTVLQPWHGPRAGSGDLDMTGPCVGAICPCFGEYIKV